MFGNLLNKAELVMMLRKRVFVNPLAFFGPFAFHNVTTGRGDTVWICLSVRNVFAKVRLKLVDMLQHLVKGIQLMQLNFKPSQQFVVALYFSELKIVPRSQATE